MKTTTQVLLTGASGTVGIEVLRLLVKDKAYQVTVFDKNTRHAVKLLSPYQDRINIIYGDLCKQDDVLKIPGDIDVAIHLAAIIPPESDENTALTFQVNVQGTKGIITLLELTSPKAFLLYSSSISVYGDRILNPGITRNDLLNPSDGDEYGETKIQAEALIRNSKLDWSIFRLSAIMKNHKMSKLMFHMPLNTQLEICSPKDTAKAFVEAMNKREALSGKIFNLGGGESCRITYEVFLEKSFRLFGLGKVNFPHNTFAQRNFHCGIMKDGDILENILHFRNDTLDSYFKDTKHSIPFMTKIFSTLFRVIIKRILANQSEPLRAIKTNNYPLINHFFLKKDQPLPV